MTAPLVNDSAVSRRAFVATFLKGAGCFAVAAALPFAPRALPARGRAPRRYHFPQGLASGDPTPHTVVLWTRVEATRDGGASASAPVAVTLQVATAPDFSRVVAERRVTATAATDHTVRVVVTDLVPDTRYYYRFLAGAGDAQDVSDLTGRTRTAPPPDADRVTRLAFVSCQAYEGGWYGAWRTMLNEDAARPDGEQLDFVLHLGDFIYEALGYGGARRVAPLPSGGAPVDAGSGKAWAETYAVSVDDYRHLYRTYLADPDLRAARARWPFVVTWDDHEFSDDCWQGASTYGGPPEPAQARRLAASRAWFEYIPALLTGAPPVAGAAPNAHDLRPARVRDASLAARDADGFYQEPNNRAAVGALTIYRAFRWGRHIDLVVSDLRSYRSEHCVPAALGRQVGGAARYFIPLGVARVFDAGRAYDGGDPPAAVRVGDASVPNARRADPPGTMLGARQKRWWKETMRGSDATWRLWANSVPLMPMRVDLGAVNPKAETAVFSIDTWDGYQRERRELLEYLTAAGVRNVVSLTGDNHNHFAGVAAADFDAEAPRAAAVEFATAGISSESVYAALRAAVRPEDPMRALIAYDPAAHGGAGPELPALNVTWLWGARAAAALARTGDVRQAEAARDPRHNPHLRYVDSTANGFGLAAVFADRVEAELVTTETPSADRGAAGGRVLRRARFTARAWDAAGGARLDAPAVAGAPPFPLRRA